MLKKTSPLRNEKGMAIMEMIPILIIFVLLLNFSLGFFGVVHTGILNSIAARNYAFETFRHRSNLMYFMVDSAENAKIFYKNDQQRMHTTMSETAITKGGNETVGTSRLLDFFPFSRRQVEETGSQQDHDTGILEIQAGKRFEGNGVNPVRVKTAYGICLSTPCGGT
jgi:hypothetical protein